LPRRRAVVIQCVRADKLREVTKDESVEQTEGSERFNTFCGRGSQGHS